MTDRQTRNHFSEVLRPSFIRKESYFFREKEWVRAGLLANEIIINTALLRRHKITKICVSYVSFQGMNVEEHFAVDPLLSINQWRESLPYSYLPLNKDAPLLKVEFFNQEESVRDILIHCANWLLNIEDMTGQTAQGWLAVPRSSFVIRPFTLFQDNQEVSFEYKVTGQRDDVTYALKSYGLRGYSFELAVGSRSRTNRTEMLIMYTQKHLQHTENVNNGYCTFLASAKNWASVMRKSFSATTTSRAHTRSVEQTEAIAIVMPIYDGFSETLEAIETIRLACGYIPGQINIRFLLGLDKPKSPLNREIQRLYAGDTRFTIIENPQNLGFVGNCNNLFAHIKANEDILLVNSDIIAPASDWIMRLIDIVDKNSRVATVTPMSNQATIFSYPVPNTEQETYPHYDVNAMDNLLSQFYDPEPDGYIEVPSCHGFCTLIVNTRCKQDYLFDVVFGLGYGEENDLSQRIVEMGLINVACPSVYVYHRESISFADKKQQLIEKNLKILGHKYTAYHESIKYFCEEDPLSEIRNRSILSVIQTSVNDTYSILHVVHGRGGGTEKYLNDCINSSSEANHFVLRPINSQGCKIQLELMKNTVSGSRGISMTMTYADLNASFKSLLNVFCVQKIVVHSLVDFMEFGMSSAEWIGQGLGRELVFVLHDFHWLTYDVNLLTAEAKYKSPLFFANHALSDINYLASSSFAERFPSLKHSACAYLANTLELFKMATQIIAPSYSAKDIIAMVPQLSPIMPKISVLYHDSTASMVVYKPRPRPGKSVNKTINVGLFGAISINKGYRTLSALASYVDANQVPLKLFVVGHTQSDNELSRYRCIKITGRYSEEDLPGLLAALNLDCSLFISPWPETFSYTLSIAFMHSIWPFVLDCGCGGAPVERVIGSKYGSILTSQEPSYIAKQIVDFFHASTAQDEASPRSS